MTRTARAETRCAQIVECGGNAAERAALLDSEGPDVGVALEANEPLLVADQHLRIRRPMRLMTRGAAFHLNRSMLESERPTLVAVAFVAARLIRFNGSDGIRKEAAVGVMAIDAGHRTLR